jgi:hypothetical protein
MLLTGYSIPLRAKVIDRLHELEQAQQGPRLPRNLSEALRLAADLEDQKEALRLQNEAMKPTAEVGAAVGKRTNITVPDFAKKLKGVTTQIDAELARSLGLFSTKRLCSAPRRMRPRINGGSPAA